MSIARPPTVYSINALTRRFGRLVALDSLDLEIAEGEFLALAGHNGAGKTTLFKLMLGLLPPSDGNIRLYGRNPAESGAVFLRRRIGFLPESAAFSGNLTGQETLRFFARLKGVPSCGCETVLDDVDLGSARNKRVRTYSKGMRQRLGLAQMFLGDPSVLILDEPTTGLDPESRRHFFELLAARKQAGATIILSSHTLSEIEEYTDRVAFLRRGKLVACGSLGALQADSGLPVRVRIRAASGLAERVGETFSDVARIKSLNGSQVDLFCSQADQSEVLRRLGATEFAGGVDVRPPRLEDIYHRYQGASISTATDDEGT
ncbi:MAG: ABC transporter ATP-binding protein [Rhodospirillaceae bacterium]|nr:ABC transporter ATP-binding protein [Rhodospirillaceae bacterium]